MSSPIGLYLIHTHEILTLQQFADRHGAGWTPAKIKDYYVLPIDLRTKQVLKDPETGEPVEGCPVLIRGNEVLIVGAPFINWAAAQCRSIPRKTNGPKKNEQGADR